MATAKAVHKSARQTEPWTDTTADNVKYPGPGFRIGPYVIRDVLGHGSMATVYLATDETGDEVAIKLFQEGPGVSATMLERFRREAEASKKLRRHPNIIKIYATGQDGPYHYIVMECIRNSKTLENLVEQSSISQTGVVQMMVKIARALQYAHIHRVIHRDVKPSNIMVDEFGEPLLSDFGVAELVDLPSCTVTGALTGTPLYMSPEQARAERVGPASDIYSLGVVLFEALTGVLPYHVQHFSPVKEVIEAVKSEPPRRPRLFRKEVSPDLEAVILKALAKEPRERYMDAEAFAVDLERTLAGRPVSAQRFSPLDHLRHLARRYHSALNMIMFIAVISMVGGYLAYKRLLAARYENVLKEAQLKNLEYRLSQTQEKKERTNPFPQAWHEIRNARRAMQSSDWAGAASGFKAAVELSRTMRDERTVAIAQLDYARCELLLGHGPQAKTIYSDVMRNPDASASINGFALTESLELMLLEGDQKAAVNLLREHMLPTEGPLKDAILCLGGEIGPDVILERIGRMPDRFVNDVLLAVAVRFFADGEIRRYHQTLRSVLQSSAPTSEWPGPFARSLLNRVQD